MARCVHTAVARARPSHCGSMTAPERGASRSSLASMQKVSAKRPGTSRVSREGDLEVPSLLWGSLDLGRCSDWNSSMRKRRERRMMGAGMTRIQSTARHLVCGTDLVAFRSRAPHEVPSLVGVDTGHCVLGRFGRGLAFHGVRGLAPFRGVRGHALCPGARGRDRALARPDTSSCSAGMDAPCSLTVRTGRVIASSMATVGVSSWAIGRCCMGLG